MGRFVLSRRTMLRGAGGVAIGLPLLQIMAEQEPRAADLVPRRFVVAYSGISLGCDGVSSPISWTPRMTGTGYDLGADISPFGKTARQGAVRTFPAYDVQNEVSIVSGCQIPWAELGQPTPPDGRPANFHGYTVGPLLMGLAYQPFSGAPGPSADQIVAGQIGTTTRFSSLQLMIQNGDYEGGGNSRSEISFKRNSKSGVSIASNIVSPHAAWKKLFFDAPLPTAELTPEQKQAQLAAQQAIINRNKSLLDFVLLRAGRLKARLGKSDQTRLESHFDELRALENRLTQIPDLRSNPQCKVVGEPGADPPLDNTIAQQDRDYPAVTWGWSDEDTRGDVMCRLLHMALTCDLTRSATLCISSGQSYMNTKALCGVSLTVHHGSHGGLVAGDRQGSRRLMDDVVAWHVGFYARLVQMLQKTKEIDGTSVLDNSVLLHVTEGGGGYNAEDGSSPSSHSSQNMAVMLAGGRALGLQPGQHIKMNNDLHPAAVVRTAMKAVGVDMPLGKVTAEVPKLRA